MDAERPFSAPLADTVPRTATGSESHGTIRWILLDGRRPVLVLLVSVGIFALVFGLSWLGVLGVTRPPLVTGAFSAAITGVFTLVSVTVSINQVVLSRILGSPGQIRRRRDSVQTYREEVASLIDDVAVGPTHPSGLLQVVIAGVSRRAKELRHRYGGHHPPNLRNDVDNLATELEKTAEQVQNGLGRGDEDLFRTLLVVLNDRYSRHLYTVDRIQVESENLSHEERRALDRIRDALDKVMLTRHYFKTLYIHQELTDMSRLLLVTGLPALVVAFGVIFFYGGIAAAVSPVLRQIIVSSCVTIVIVPLTVLFAYGLRLATIGKRTATFGSLTPPGELP